MEINVKKIYRCRCKNFTNNNICKNKTQNPFYINNKPACKFHYNYLIGNNAIVIQKYWRSYKKRIYINNIYSKLPCDIQSKILYYVRQEYYYKKSIKTLNNIIENRIINCCLDLNERFLMKNFNQWDLLETINYLDINIINIINNFKLYSDYYHIIKKTNRSENFNRKKNKFMEDLYDSYIIVRHYNEDNIYGLNTNILNNLTYKLNYLYQKIAHYLTPFEFISSEA